MAEGNPHKPLFIALIVAVVLVFIVDMAINALASNPSASGGLYKNTTGDLSDLYYVEITPSGWTFSIWGFIYAWQAALLVYGVTLLFRKTDQGPAYVNPAILTPVFYGIYVLNLCFNIAWMLLWDRQQLEIAFVDLFLISFTLYVCLFFTYRNLDRNMETLTKQGRRVDVWLVRGIVHNGLAIYATWTTVATLLNLSTVMTYRSALDISQDVAATVCLGILSLEIVVFLVTDLIFLDRYSRYTVTPYLVLVVALTGSITKNWSAGARNSIFTVVLLSVAGLALLVKLVLLVWRHIKNPITAKVTVSEKSEYKV